MKIYRHINHCLFGFQTFQISQIIKYSKNSAKYQPELRRNDVLTLECSHIIKNPILIGKFAILERLRLKMFGSRLQTIEPHPFSSCRLKVLTVPPVLFIPPKKFYPACHRLYSELPACSDLSLVPPVLIVPPTNFSPACSDHPVYKLWSRLF